MTQPSLTEKQQAKLEQIWKFAQGTEEKLHKIAEMSEKIAQKWQQRKEVKESLEK